MNAQEPAGPKIKSNLKAAQGSSASQDKKEAKVVPIQIIRDSKPEPPVAEKKNAPSKVALAPPSQEKSVSKPPAGNKKPPQPKKATEMPSENGVTGKPPMGPPPPPPPPPPAPPSLPPPPPPPPPGADIPADISMKYLSLEILHVYQNY